MSDTESDRAEVRSPHLLAGRYRLGGVISSNAAGTVYWARDAVLGRDVAVKLLREGARGSVTAGRQLDEARIAASVHHVGLTTVFDAGVCIDESGVQRAYIVMELVRGGDLRRRLLGGALPWRDVCSLGIDVAEGLAHLHAHGIVHRDVKPANIVLSIEPGSERLQAKLTDFGIATIGVVQATPASGTAAYISPEQVHGDAPTHKSDVYALGLVLAEAASGRVEYPGPPERSVLARLRQSPNVPSTVPEPLAAVIRAMTDGQPGQRPSAAEASASLTTAAALDRLRASLVDPSLARLRADARAAELDRYAMLDWPPVHSFATAVILARRLCTARYACVVIDGPHGLHVSSASAGLELPDGLPTSSWLEGDEHLESWSVEDFGLDARCRQDDLLNRIGVRSFAGAPIVTAYGERLGTLCVFDDRPREYSSESLSDLASLSLLVLRELQLRLASRRAVLAR